MKQRFERRARARASDLLTKECNRLRDNLVRKCLVRLDDPTYRRFRRRARVVAL